MDSDAIRAHLISAGVKNLRQYGYPKVNADNILTDRIYSAFFKVMLEDNRGHSQAVDRTISGLLAELEKAHER
jgi:replicative DNA helicase